MAKFEDKREQVFWHIAPKQADHVAELIHKAIGHYLNGDLGNWFWTLTALREIVNHEMKDKERDGMDLMEKEAMKYVNFWEKYSKKLEDGFSPNEKLKQRKSEFLVKTKTYQRKLFDMLKALGYFPDKEDRTSLNF